MSGITYLDVITEPELIAFQKMATEVFPGFTTIIDSYSDKLDEMKRALADYFNDSTLERPFLYLVLGPPGAGKSYLLSTLVERLKTETTGPIAYQAVNVSEVLDPREVHRLYENILRNNEVGVKTVTLFDEVDVRWRDGAAIKYLINPIYDGKYWDGSQFRKFGRCAFFFAGSYLQDRETLIKTQRVLTGLDLSRLLLDLYLAFVREGNLQDATKVQQALDFCHVQQRWRAHADPQTDTILYLRNLDKMRDFLSRIAGNVFEMVDVSAPLHVTQEAFVVSDGQSVHASQRLRPVEVVRMIKKQESKSHRFAVFPSATEALLQYKDALLCERLLRVTQLIRRRFDTKVRREARRPLHVKRTVLNYLAVAPLLNGMRSLEQLVNRLALQVDTVMLPSNLAGVSITQSGFKHEEIAMIVHSPEDFADVTHVWHRLARINPKLAALLASKGTSETDDVALSAATASSRP